MRMPNSSFVSPVFGAERTHFFAEHYPPMCSALFHWVITAVRREGSTAPQGCPTLNELRCGSLFVHAPTQRRRVDVGNVVQRQLHIFAHRRCRYLAVGQQEFARALEEARAFVGDAPSAVSSTSSGTGL